mmetsp:Transcript_16361/g.27666  ORF Transcript_16361/g.27666 Transcript_16361/m.27666 type:complete len:105 (-) Transcript_16361:814-1128(-)
MFLFESCVYILICLFFMLISDNWKLLQIPNFIMTTLGIIFLIQMPESPRFLISQRRFADARQVFTWIGLKNGLKLIDIEQKLELIQFEGEAPVGVGSEPVDQTK